MLGGEGVELGVLAGLQTLVGLRVSVELAGGQHELAKVVLVGRLDPSKLSGINHYEINLGTYQYKLVSFKRRQY